jgi:hypothetical protein
MEYITGNKFKNFCNYYFEGRDLILNKQPQYGEIIKVFVKTDFIDSFFYKFFFSENFIIFTHNSDYGINSNHIRYLNLPNVIAWYAQNIYIDHPKLKSIPIGIANEEWIHGNTLIIESARSKNFKKNNLIYANFNIRTNPKERSHCANCISRHNVKINSPTKFKEYIDSLSKSYFSISPNGNGVDCHKTWESLYLKTIPIVTKSINSVQYKNLPIVIIDDWSDFQLNSFSLELYESIWYNFNIDKLNFTSYVSSILHSQEIPN